MLLVGGGGEGERVVLLLAQLQAGHTHPLARLVVHVGGPLNQQHDHVWGTYGTLAN